MNANTPSKKLGFTLSLVAAACLSGCGGGGGGTHGENAPVARQAAAPPPAVPQAALTSRVAVVAQPMSRTPVGARAVAPENAPANAPEAREERAAPGADVAGGGSLSLSQFAQNGGTLDFVRRHGSQWDEVRVPAGARPSPDLYAVPQLGAADGRNAEFGVDLHHKAITSVEPLDKASERAPASTQSFVALSNALLQVAIHDPEYAARLAFTRLGQQSDTTLQGRPAHAVFRLLYAEYDWGARYRNVRLQEYIEALSNRPAFDPAALALDDPASDLARVMGIQGLRLPVARIALGGANARSASEALLGAYRAMDNQLIERAQRVPRVAYNLHDYQGRGIVTRAFVLDHALAIDQVPNTDRLESFIVSNGSGNYAAFINMPDEETGTANWFMAADGHVYPLNGAVGVSFVLNSAIADFCEPPQNAGAPAPANPAATGIVMVVYRR